ncbi:MAG: beta-ketoacyl-ACP synthase II [Erysipelotrichaceae bacterium]
MKTRVVISGMGVVSPIGNDVETLWDSIKCGKCGIAPITNFDTTEYKVKLAAEVKDLDPSAYLERRDVKFNDNSSVFARIACKQAVADAKLDMSKEDADRVGVIIGSGIGGINSIEVAAKQIADRGPTKVSPYFIPMALVNLSAGNVAIDTGAKGICTSVVTACAAGTNAIGEAFHKIRDGYQDVMICGGCEAAITPLAIAGFASMRALHLGEDTNRASIPFDLERKGFVMGEGAGAMVIESLEHALSRNANIYGELIGYGASCDANHITAPLSDGSGGAKAMLNAIKDADIKTTDVEYINAHGTSTPLNDSSETTAVKAAFKDHAYKLAISSTKSNTGHLLGASGAVEAIITTKALCEGLIPATINYKVEDPECDLDIVPNNNRKADIQIAMSNSLGFGGHNASIIIKKWTGK